MSIRRKEGLDVRTARLLEDVARSYKCPACGLGTAVIDSRSNPGGIRRRRECKNGHRVTTYESSEDPDAMRLLVDKAREAAKDFLRDSTCAPKG